MSGPGGSGDGGSGGSGGGGAGPSDPHLQDLTATLSPPLPPPRLTPSQASRAETVNSREKRVGQTHYLPSFSTVL